MSPVLGQLGLSYEWSELNGWLFGLAQAVRPQALDPALTLISALGSFSAALLYARVIGGAALSIARNGNGLAIRCRLHAAWARTLARFLLATVVAAVTAWTLKTWLHLPRPWEVYGAVFGETTLLVDFDGSFPSGHATFTAVVVGSLWPRAAHRASRAVLLLFLVCVGLARVLLGAHFPLDVLGGYAVGFGSVWLADRLLRHTRYLSGACERKYGAHTQIGSDIPQRNQEV